jgi:molecular chaperone GrpE
MTEKELETVLNKHGIFEINCKEKPFNPEQAEALSQVPTSDLEEGHVFDVMRKGYLYHDKVLRHAQVVIATKPAENNK